MSYRGGPIRSSASATTVPGWRAEDFLRFETNFLEEGVVSGLGVTQRGAGANMSVDVAAGLALIDVTTTLLSPNDTSKTWFLNDATVNVAVTTADLTNPRKDRVVAKFDVSIDPNGTASDNVSISVIAGTPAGSPSAPAEPSNAITLAIIDVPASDTTIGTAQITDSRTYVTLDTGVLADIVRTTTFNPLVSDLAALTNGKGASKIGVEDSAAYFTATNVETVLAEMQATILAFTSSPAQVLRDFGLHATSFSGTTPANLNGQHSITGNTAAVGRSYEFQYRGTLDCNDATAAIKFHVGSHSIQIMTGNNAPGTPQPYSIRGHMTITATGASGKVIYWFETKLANGTTVQTQTTAEQTIDFTATALLKFSITGSGGGTSGTFNQHHGVIDRFN